MPDPVLLTEQRLALRSAAARLATEFAGLFSSETIERFLNASWDQFATDATDD